ncbi:hypothetical protein AOLI_G00229440 [Acnodon oligacanthus]
MDENEDHGWCDEQVQEVPKHYKEAGSIQRAFACLSVDRNTVARTAPITELSIASPDVFASLRPWNDKSLLYLQIHAILFSLQTSKNK